MQPNEELRDEAELQNNPYHRYPSNQRVRRHRAEGESSKLDTFDDSGDVQPQTQTQAIESNEIAGTASRTKWSKNTVKSSYGPLKAELTDGPQVLKFKEVSDKASRRAGAAFFFRTTQSWGLRDCLKLNQSEPFGEIEVQSQDRLWEVLEEQAIV
ncbi:hypothetical protein Pst134EB_009942 [Puccinia striiformis f. sp. tritici]|nr:hypothetical protein Pst134EB_009942 [Puccinia striiformis f. sp. tritici]